MKALKKICLALLTIIMLFGVTACGESSNSGGGSGSDPADDSTKTTIRVANFGGGIGRQWLDEAVARFSELKKDESYEDGKTGVKFDITHAIGVTCKEMKTQGHNIFFLQNKYTECFNEIQKGSALDITDVVTGNALAEYGENVTIESKIDENYRFAMKGNDGRYYMLPHYETQSAASYDVDMFENMGFYLALTGEGTAYNCALAGGTYYFTGEADEKTVGNDGIRGTDDDGLPTTLNELVAMCDYIYSENNVIPFSVPGSHIDYTNYLIEGLWTGLSGYEQRNAVVSHEGTVDYVTSLSDEEVWPGTGIKKPITEKATLAGSQDGYKAINSAGRYYSFAFIELAYKKGWIYDKYQQSNYNHKDAMRAFILNGIGTNKKIAAHIEGSYWYNEAKGYGLFNDYKILSGTGAEYKNIAHWHMPTSYGNDVVTDESNSREEAAINGMTSTVMVNGNIADKPGLVRACKEFIAFLSTEQELENFTACTGVSKALYDYEINDYVLSKLDPYQKTVMRLRASNRIVNQYGDNATYRAKANYMIYSISATGYHPYFDGVTYNSPLEAYYKTAATGKYKGAWECFQQTGFTQSAWMSEIYAE